MDGKIHTNGLENFWIVAEARHLAVLTLALNHFTCSAISTKKSFRYNNRELPTGRRPFPVLAVSQVTGKRLTYEQLTDRRRGAPETRLNLNRASAVGSERLSVSASLRNFQR